MVTFQSESRVYFCRRLFFTYASGGLLNVSESCSNKYCQWALLMMTNRASFRLKAQEMAGTVKDPHAIRVLEVCDLLQERK
jgi:hypothetical protein